MRFLSPAESGQTSVAFGAHRSCRSTAYRLRKEQRVEKLIWALVPVGFICAGVYMVVWPADAALTNRDDKDDTTPPSSGEKNWTRGIGAVMVVGGAYMLYRL